MSRPPRPRVHRRATNLAQLLVHTARAHPDRDALVVGDERISWRELQRLVRAAAAELRRSGVAAGDVVMLHSPNSAGLVTAMLATWYAGAVVVPTNFRLTPSEVVELAEVCRPVGWIGHRDFPDHTAAMAQRFPDLLLRWSIDGSPDPSVVSLDDVVADQEPAQSEPAAVWDDDPCWYFFTSGSSGTPKAAVLTHAQLTFVITNHLCDLMPDTTVEDVSLVLAPLSHGAGVHFLTQLARGARSILLPGPFEPPLAWQTIEAERVTNMFAVPTLVNDLVSAHHGHDASSLRYVVYAGAPMARRDQQRALEVLGPCLVQYYGLAEVTGNITVLDRAGHGRPEPSDTDFGTCGVPRLGMQLSIQDSDGRPLPAGTQGEVCVCGPAVFAGYLDNPDANAHAFRDGWFRTGDLGHLDNQGYLYLTGRASETYISGGSNIHPRELEEKILDHPAVREVAVVGVPDPRWGEVGIAVCVLADDQPQVGPHELREWCRTRMARYKVPKQIALWPELPRSGYGKIDKLAIRRRLLRETAT